MAKTSSIAKSVSLQAFKNTQFKHMHKVYVKKTSLCTPQKNDNSHEIYAKDTGESRLPSSFNGHHFSSCHVLKKNIKQSLQTKLTVHSTFRDSFYLLGEYELLLSQTLAFRKWKKNMEVWGRKETHKKNMSKSECFNEAMSIQLSRFNLYRILCS